ncbi:ribbon-helix-helix domain-containing protein [Paraburkholderia azotifigens]|uniref:Ribbon-helix-helix domain-containing protein n=1 Tax=Paraburkholderia azotifigens TaxID=2057004 RepID=A0A5C6VMC9_9BURK|nr:ribbon-helix-helix domain-containing protein [Paraburkholderia azotifigens]TXC86170.1 ribbon-helix-helix domain-containing protein [Paraburkholderia azotifigens]
MATMYLACNPNYSAGINERQRNIPFSELGNTEVEEFVRAEMTRTTNCNLSADLLKPRQRSIRVNGLATCMRLEEIYWSIIEELARSESLTVGKLISRWAMEMDLAQGSVWNFTGYIRVVCVMQLINRASPALSMEFARSPASKARGVR